jgi:mono/diheme cytochrome c family protein
MRPIRGKMEGMRTTAMYLLAALAVSACKTPSRSEHARTPDAEPSSPASGGDAREATVQARMQGHERHGDAMRDAVARGDLDEAKAEAKLLAELRIEGPTGKLWKQMFDAMRAAAARSASASDLKQAGRDVGLVARTCGDCHAMFGRAGVLVEPPGALSSGTQAGMRRHQWATEMLWDGLVVPSDDAWNAGALALSEAPLVPEQLTPGKSPVPRVGELAQAVHNLGVKAAGAKPVEARADVYGELVATCSECHTWLGGGPHPGQLP